MHCAADSMLRSLSLSVSLSEPEMLDSSPVKKRERSEVFHHNLRCTSVADKRSGSLTVFWQKGKSLQNNYNDGVSFQRVLKTPLKTTRVPSCLSWLERYQQSVKYKIIPVNFFLS